LLSLLERAGVPYRQFYHLKRKDETLRVISENIGDYLAGFALTRRPSNHCFSIDQWTGDAVSLMDPDPHASKLISLKWDDLFVSYDADILWIFK